ncbi:TrmH family RNA methyltransferase [Flammeovirga agarivorans]|uniref:RNA methyltransferase n=1 Tax=Flammeovirga agarivorans TaxID=2726742 RepID=A0A7X8SLJ3_9BACT|nr:RNA methyltransferase [Flammeovirga agarivorans]NLR92460.1 RNA methyltransferase [Flammeovirga agarivorans]
MNKRWSKEVRALLQKKKRKETQQFIVEGYKNLEELFRSDLEIEALFHTEKLLPLLDQYKFNSKVIDDTTTPTLLKQNGHLQTNDTGLAIVKMPSFSIPSVDDLDSFSIALDDVRDPGNLGTILRIADWYGIKNIFLSKQCTDAFAPKVIASSMGAFTRIKFHTVDLVEQLSEYKEKGIQIIGADMNGENIHDFKPKGKSIMVMGSESHGISDEIHKILSTKITIPKYGGAESLNVAIATAIICDNIKRV